MGRFSKPPRYANPQASVIDLIDQLELVFEETNITNNTTVDVADDSVDYDWIKSKVKEEIKGPLWTKYQAIMSLEEFEDGSKVTNKDIAAKLNDIIKALKA